LLEPAAPNAGGFVEAPNAGGPFVAPNAGGLLDAPELKEGVEEEVWKADAAAPKLKEEAAGWDCEPNAPADDVEVWVVLNIPDRREDKS